MGEYGLDEAFAEGGFADDEGAVVVLHGTRNDFSRGGGVAVDENHDGILQAFFAAGGAVGLVGGGAAALRNHQLTLLQELVAHIDGLVDQPAGVAAEVDDETLKGTLLAELVERFADFACGVLLEAGNVHIADAGANLEGKIDGGAGDFVAGKVEGEVLGRALACDDDRNVGAACALEQRGDGGRIHAVGGLAVDRNDLVAGPDAGLERRRAFKGEEHEDAQGTVHQLRLDGHADAVVAAVLLFAHLRVCLRIVEVGMGVERVQHARDGSIVDGLVAAVGVHLFGVVLLYDGVDGGEGLERVAQGGLVGRGLRRHPLADDGAEDAAGGEKKRNGKESASGAWGHRLQIPRGRGAAF